ncbi:MAG: hypothetical protein FWE58_00470 [Methanobrevibacter sp.]|nr:hypothetical protein [Methanobrevibacter sp.]
MAKIEKGENSRTDNNAKSSNNKKILLIIIIILIVITSVLATYAFLTLNQDKSEEKLVVNNNVSQIKNVSESKPQVEQEYISKSRAKQIARDILDYEFPDPDYIIEITGNPILIEVNGKMLYKIPLFFAYDEYRDYIFIGAIDGKIYGEDGKGPYPRYHD